jgi:hypothetical protein
VAPGMVCAGEAPRATAPNEMVVVGGGREAGGGGSQGGGSQDSPRCRYRRCRRCRLFGVLRLAALMSTFCIRRAEGPVGISGK